MQVTKNLRALPAVMREY